MKKNNTNETNIWLILAVVLVGTFMSTLDGSIVNVALPNMAVKLKVSISTIQWVVSTYLMVISTLILIFGRIGDIKGKKNVYQTGLLIFSFGSLLCGMFNNIVMVIFSRVIQAVGASMMMSCSFAIITMTFPAKLRGRALGILGTAVALGSMVGPPLGGLLVGYFSWKSIFLINVPIGIAAFFLGIKILPKEEKHHENVEPFDIKGAVSFAAGIIFLISSLLNGEVLGWHNIIIILGLAAALISLIIFCITEMKTEYPMVDFSLFQNKMFSVSIICAFISFMAIFFTNIIHPFYLQYVLKASPEKAGLLMIVFPITVFIVAPISGRLSDKIGYKFLTLAGLILTGVGILLMGFLTEKSSYLDVILRVGIMAFGNGLFQSPNNACVMSSVPKNKLGIAGSINALIRNLGMVCGIAFSMTLLYDRMSAKIGHSVTDFVPGRPDAFIYGMKFIYTLAAIVTLAGVLMTLFRVFDKGEEHEETQEKILQ